MSRALDPERFEALTFDCYGTLIDWLGGVRGAVAELPSLGGCDVERLVRERDTLEREIEAGPYRSYAEVLRESMTLAAARQARTLPRAEAERFARSIESWAPFEESSAMLRRLAARYRLAILSNVDTKILQASIAALAAPFETFVTAEEVRSYKPARAHFDAGLRKLGLPHERVLHVACSWFHDIAPTLALGWSSAWVNRESERAPEGPAPALVTSDLAGVVRALEC